MNFLNNTKLIFKSVLDLVPAVLLAIIVAIIAGYGMNSLNKNFNETLTIIAWLEKYALKELDNARKDNKDYLNFLILTIWL